MGIYTESESSADYAQGWGGTQKKERSYIYYKRNVAAEYLKVTRNASGLCRTQFEYHCPWPFFDCYEIQLLLVGVRF
jgi:hypothetical protein